MIGQILALATSMSLGAGLILLAEHHINPSARIFTNVDDGTPLNHGQKSIEITLPPGAKFTSFGGCGPSWKSDGPGASWTSIVCEIEKYDPEIKGYRPAPLFGEAER